MNEHSKLLWEALKIELGESDALSYISDMKEIGLDLKANTKWCVENRQTIFETIVAWKFGLLKSILKIKKEL